MAFSKQEKVLDTKTLEDPSDTYSNLILESDSCTNRNDMNSNFSQVNGITVLK